MNTEKRLVLVEIKEGANIEEVLNNNGIKVLENEAIKGGAILKVDDFFANELRQEYLLTQEWFRKPVQEKDPMLLEITEETYNKAE